MTRLSTFRICTYHPEYSSGRFRVSPTEILLYDFAVESNDHVGRIALGRDTVRPYRESQQGFRSEALDCVDSSTDCVVSNMIRTRM